MQVELGERVLGDIFRCIAIVEHEVGGSGHRGKLGAKKVREVDCLLRRMLGRGVALPDDRSSVRKPLADNKGHDDKTGAGAAIGLPTRRDKNALIPSGQGDETFHPGADRHPARLEVRRQRVDDVGALPLTGDDASLAQHLEMMADGGLADRAALDEIAGTHRIAAGGDLPHDRQPNGIGQGLQESDVGVGSNGHAPDYIEISGY